MSAPWFRRYYFSFKPTSWQGWAVVIVMMTVTALFFFISDHVTQSRPLLASVFGGIGLTVFFAGLALVFWKMDWGYRRP